MRFTRIIVQFLVYFILPCFFLGSALQPSHIPGAERSDVWNALWSLHWFAESVLDFDFSFQTPLNHPTGGRLWPADLLHSLLILPLIPFFSIGTSYTVLCICLHTLLGWATHQWVCALQSKGHPLVPFVAGLALQSSSIVLVAIHNGSSEAMGGCWVVLALWHFCVLVKHDKWQYRTTFWCVLAFWSSWYLALVTGIYALAILLTHNRISWRSPLISLSVAFILTCPLAWLSLEFSAGAENLLRIKSPAALEQVRRTVGGAEVLSYFWPTHRSPDFRFISRFGEQFVHSTYLGWGLILTVLSAWRYIPRWVWISGGLCFLLSLGPVLIINAEPFVWDDRFAIPMPYFFIENWPGFNHLSLLFRLAFGVQLAAILAMIYLQRPIRDWIIILAVVLTENIAHATYQGVPQVTALPPVSAVRLIADEPDGGVAYYPHVAARPTLYLQLFHQKPVAAGLNFPHNAASKRIWMTALEAEHASGTQFKLKVAEVARKGQIRYLVLMNDPSAMPDVYRKAALRIRKAFGIYASDSSSDVVRFW